jgi:hypothetical protein
MALIAADRLDLIRLFPREPRSLLFRIPLLFL